MKNFLTATFVALFALCANATVENLLPTPQKADMLQGSYSIPSSIAISDPTNCFALQNFLTENNITIADNAPLAITVEIVNEIPGSYDYTLAAYDNEAYSLAVTTDGIKIQAVKPIGVTRAAQTLAQLAQDSNGTIQCVNITDWPAFKLRGFMHDVGRSFISVEELKREIDLLSRFKVNTFHWHLTDYTGWRMEIKAYPQLTGEKGISRFPGMFYSQEDAKEIQDYAAERGMIVIPEIDMPGHSHPFESAMGFGMQTQQGIDALKVILNEVCALFDKAPYIHIGGDEVSFNDQYIIDMINYVHTLGKKVVIWNRYNAPAKIVDPKVIPCDMVTNWATSGTLASGLPNVDMRYNYINHFDVFADLVGIYKSSIFYVEKGNADVAGTITGIWNDTMVPSEEDIIRQNNFYANVLASAERAWIGGGEQYIETGGTHLPNSGTEFEAFADWERRFLHHKNTTLAPARDLIPYVKQTNVSWYLTDQIPNGGSKTKQLEPENFINADALSMPTSFDINGATYGVQKITGAGHYLRHIWHGTVKGVYPNPQTSVTSYAWTYIYSPIEQDVAAFIEFYTYSRSGAEKMPPANCWDRRGSRIWLNGTEIQAPQWIQPDKDIPQNSNTEGLRNENFTARPATPIHLNQGWNKVFMKLPYVDNGGTKRNKWQFTFVVVDPQGSDAIDGLVYSPTASIDKESEAVAELINEVRASVKAKINDLPGFYKSSAADVALLNKAAEIEETLGSPMSAQQRAEQKQTLQALYDSFLQNYKAAGINQPQPGILYNLCSKLRNNRYITDNSGALIGAASPSRASAWKFVPRTDGKFDIVNAQSGQYINTSAAYDSQMKTGSNQPSTGWEIKPADTDGLVIVSNGSVQLNQTNNEHKIFNWGNGTNTADLGCQFAFSISIDEECETLANRISEIRNSVNNKVRDLPGYYNSSSADVALLEAANEIEATLNQQLSAQERNDQIERLNKLYEIFLQNYKSAGLSKPKPGMFYNICSSLRGNRYVTDENNALVGAASASEAAAWTFKERPDGSYDIVNFYTNNYVNTNAPTNSQLKTGTNAPSKGWELNAAATDGHLIIVNGSSQFNQTNSGLGNLVYNWGDGTNTTDSGCQFSFAETEFITDAINSPEFNTLDFKTVKGGIFANSNVEVYNLQGTCIAKGKGRISLPAGIAIIKNGNSTTKVNINNF